MNNMNSNTGYRNTGDSNTGDSNTGDSNTGDSNTGYKNTGYRNTGYFNIDTPKVRIFGKETDVRREDIEFPDFLYFRLAEWINIDDMTQKEKDDNAQHEALGGYLKVYEYKEAFKKSWDNATEEDRKLLLKLPNFDADIFFEISGIDIRENNKRNELLKKADELIEKANELKKQAELV